MASGPQLNASASDIITLPIHSSQVLALLGFMLLPRAHLQPLLCTKKAQSFITAFRPRARGILPLPSVGFPLFRSRSPSRPALLPFLAMDAIKLLCPSPRPLKGCIIPSGNGGGVIELEFSRSKSVFRSSKIVGCASVSSLSLKGQWP